MIKRSTITISNMPSKKVTTPIKSTEGSSLTHEESEDLEFVLSQLENKFNEIDGSMLKNVDLSRSSENVKREIEKKMNINNEEIKKSFREEVKELKKKSIKGSS